MNGPDRIKYNSRINFKNIQKISRHPGTPLTHKPAASESSTLDHCLPGRGVVLNSREPEMNTITGEYFMEFGDRVGTPSVKNCQVEDENGEVFYEFGKFSKNKFNLHSVRN